MVETNDDTHHLELLRHQVTEIEAEMAGAWEALNAVGPGSGRAALQYRRLQARRVDWIDAIDRVQRGSDTMMAQQ